jgi:flagellar assembly factor FliW
MPQIQTKCFGLTEYRPESVFRFPSGLAGFETEKAFVFIEREDAHPLLFMQSVRTPSLCFIVLPVFAADPHYRLQLTAEDRAELDLPPVGEPEIGKDIFCGVIVCTAREQQPAPTANLLAPVVLNLRLGLGMQVIQTNSGYSHVYRLQVEQEMSPCS